jgi:hypothetical protein
MADIIHSWASQFAEMAAASEQGEKINEPNQS